MLAPMARAALLVVLSALLVLTPFAAAQSPQSITDVRIASVSGCVDQYPVTVNCSLATTLRLRTAAGFPASYEWSSHPLYMLAEIDGRQYFATSTAQLDTSDPTNTTALVNVTAASYFPHITGVLVSLSFIDYWATPIQYSVPFAGFSFTFEGPPVLTAISGCEGSGQVTRNCVPDATTLTLVGSGLNWYGAGRGQGYYGAGGTWVNIGNLTSGTGGLVSVLNDSYATLSLSWSYNALLRPQHYAGVVLPFSLSSSGYTSTGKTVAVYTSNELQISFVPLPPPNITQWYLYDCAESNGTLRTYTDCLPGVSRVYLDGTYLYDVQVSVGGVACAHLQSYYAYFYYCRLPAFEYDPSARYDLVATNDAGSVTLRGLVQFTSRPTLASIDTCVDRGDLDSVYYEGVQCPAGTTITMRGSRFNTADSIAVKWVSAANSNVTLVWSAPKLINSTALAITLDPLDDAAAALVYGQSGSITVLLTTNNVTTTTNALSNTLYIALDAPNITAVTSAMCDTVSALQLTNCRATASITLVGTNLAPYGLTEPWLLTSVLGVFQGSNLLVAAGNTTFSTFTNTTLVFQLPYFDAYTDSNLQPDTIYTMFLYTYATYKDSNAFRISLTYGLGDAPTAGSSSSTLSAGAIAGIVVAVVLVAVVLLAGVVWLLRRRQRGGSSGGLASSKFGSDGLQSSLQSGKRSGNQYKDLELN